MVTRLDKRNINTITPDLSSICPLHLLQKVLCPIRAFNILYLKLYWENFLHFQKNCFPLAKYLPCLTSIFWFLCHYNTYLALAKENYMNLRIKKILRLGKWKWRSLTAAASSSSMVNSFFLTVLSWFRKLNSAAFFWSLANLFSYFDTFFNVGLMLIKSRMKKISKCNTLKSALQFSSQIIHGNVELINLEVETNIKHFNIWRWSEHKHRTRTHHFKKNKI